jgi:hypothetical protein
MLYNLKKMAPIKLTELAHKGDIPMSVSEKMEASWITNVDQLYCLVRSMLKHGDDEQLGRLASELNTTVENLGSFKDYIEPYTSLHITNPSEAKEQGIGGGCLITEEQMDEIKKINSMDLEQFKAYQEDLRDKFELQRHVEILLASY